MNDQIYLKRSTTIKIYKDGTFNMVNISASTSIDACGCPFITIQKFDKSHIKADKRV
jgi:hypothetical protein